MTNTTTPDPLAPARGCLIGLALGLAAWAAILAGIIALILR